MSFVSRSATASSRRDERLRHHRRPRWWFPVTVAAVARLRGDIGAAHLPNVHISELSRGRAATYSGAMRTILLVILILLLIGAFPGWGYSSGWGYYPFGGIGLILLIVIILALAGRL